MLDLDRLSDAAEWIDLSFVERERTPRPAIKVGIQVHLAGLSLSNTKQILEELGVERSRTAIHNWVKKADLRPGLDGTPQEIAIDETAITIDGHRQWLFAAVDPATNKILHARLFQARTTERTLLVLRELQQDHDLDQVTFLVDSTHSLRSVLDRLGLGFQTLRHGNRNSVERVFREVKRRTSSFSNTFRNAALATAESWLRAFAVWYN